MFASAAAEGERAPVPERVARARFERVVARVRPVAETLCRQEMADRPGFDCAVSVGVDARAKHPNAYFTYGDQDARRQPKIMVTAPLLRDVRNDDELAFVIGHEYGHLIGRHMQKQDQQAIAGALLMGIVAAAATQNLPDNGQIVSDSMDIGGGIGKVAFSQTYELESDTLGTLIAKGAGYDPVVGARYFARPAQPKQVEGGLSFWGTHPPDELRLATVMATMGEIEARGGIQRKGSRSAGEPR